MEGIYQTRHQPAPSASFRNLPMSDTRTDFYRWKAMRSARPSGWLILITNVFPPVRPVLTWTIGSISLTLASSVMISIKLRTPRPPRLFRRGNRVNGRCHPRAQKITDDERGPRGTTEFDLRDVQRVQSVLRGPRSSSVLARHRLSRTCRV